MEQALEPALEVANRLNLPLGTDMFQVVNPYAYTNQYFGPDNPRKGDSVTGWIQEMNVILHLKMAKFAKLNCSVFIHGCKAQL